MQLPARPDSRCPVRGAAGRRADAGTCPRRGGAGDVRAAGRGVDAAEVAHHLVRAGPGSLVEAAEFASQAGAQALRRLAFEDAVRWYIQADASLATVDPGDADRAQVKLALGEARLAAGDRTSARADLLQVAELARRAARPDLLARAALGLGAGPAGFEVGLLDRVQIDLLNEARAALPPGADVLGALVTARLSVALTLLESPAAAGTRPGSPSHRPSSRRRRRDGRVAGRAVRRDGRT